MWCPYDAKGWTTCACGKQDKRIPRASGFSYPLDNRLYSLGLLFAMAVETEDFLRAAKTLVAIEKRAAIVLRQELAKRAKHRRSVSKKVSKKEKASCQTRKTNSKTTK